MELVSVAEDPSILAASYFKTVGKALLAPDDAGRYEDWLLQAVRSPASTTFGGLRLDTTRASERHRRLTIQPISHTP